LTLSAGTQLVDVTGFDGAADPTLPVCAPVGIPNAGKKVETLAKLSGKSGNWQAASVAATDTLEIHFQDANQPGRGGESIVGTVAGRATDARFGDPDNLGPRGVSVNFSPDATPASLTGVVASTGFVSGIATGVIQFTDDITKATSTCAGVEIIFQPLPPSLRSWPLISRR
jgi:hypothetical protein